MILITFVMSERFKIISWLTSMDSMGYVERAGDSGVSKDDLEKFIGEAQIRWTKELINSQNYSVMFKRIQSDDEMKSNFEKYKSTVIEASKDSYMAYLAKNAAYSLDNKLIQLIRVDARNRGSAENQLFLSGSDAYTIANAIIHIKSDEQGNPMSTNLKVYEAIEEEYNLFHDEGKKYVELNRYFEKIKCISNKEMEALSFNCTNLIMDAYLEEVHIHQLTRHIQDGKLIFKSFR